MNLHTPFPARETWQPLVTKHNRTRRRYAIWAKQVAAGHEPCFGTSSRLVCAEADCPYRMECRSLRAPWRR